MRVRIWNAFASNNSGSYSIVGSFPSPEIADQVAAELLPVIRAHSEWWESREGRAARKLGGAGSPLGRWAMENKLRWNGDDREDWPEYKGDNVPSVVAAGARVLIHEDYTISLPSAFGEFFFRRGGRVDIELNHAHNPLVVVLHYWVRWDDPEKEARELAMVELLDSLERELRPHLRKGTNLIIRDAPHDPGIEVAAAFFDLVEGVAAARDLARSARVSIALQLEESPSAGRDPLAHLRAAWAQDSPAE